MNVVSPLNELSGDYLGLKPMKMFSHIDHIMQILSSVDDHVSLKVWWLCETLPALITCEQFFTSVDVHVVLKGWGLCETLPALITCEQFFTSVDIHVILKVDDSVKLFLHWSHVYGFSPVWIFNVILKGWWQCETLPALITCERFSLQCGSSCVSRDSVCLSNSFPHWVQVKDLSSLLFFKSFCLGLNATQRYFSRFDIVVYQGPNPDKSRFDSKHGWNMRSRIPQDKQQEDINQTPSPSEYSLQQDKNTAERPEDHLKRHSFSLLMKLIISMHNCILCMWPTNLTILF